MPGLYRTPEEKKQLEARNGVIQFLYVVSVIDDWVPGQMLEARLLLELQRLAVNQIYSCAGSFRDGPVWISGAHHQPPDHAEIPRLVDDMCGHVNDSWQTATPVHVAAYLMWRLNWIHPFFGGNGRTSRALAYLILCAKAGFPLPGTKTVPDLIVERRDGYLDALQAADLAWSENRLDVSKMEALLESLVADQLLSAYTVATGKRPG